MSLRWLGVSFAFTFALAAQPAAANQDVACPEGQAIRAIGDKTAVCVPVPPPVNLAPLNAAINAPATSPTTVIFSTGGASVSTLEANFAYVVNPDRTIVIDDEPTNGVITKGGNRVGWGVVSLNVPKFVGHISKDWRTIQVMQE